MSYPTKLPQELSNNLSPWSSMFKQLPTELLPHELSSYSSDWSTPWAIFVQQLPIELPPMSYLCAAQTGLPHEISLSNYPQSYYPMSYAIIITYPPWAIPIVPSYPMSYPLKWRLTNNNNMENRPLSLLKMPIERRAHSPLKSDARILPIPMYSTIQLLSNTCIHHLWPSMHFNHEQVTCITTNKQ